VTIFFGACGTWRVLDKLNDDRSLNASGPLKLYEIRDRGWRNGVCEKCHVQEPIVDLYR
jgi:hypothetical protein